MGLEAQCLCTLGAQAHEVRAHLESASLMLRGPTLKRQIAVPAISDVRVAEGVLHLQADGEALGLALGSQANKWLKKLSTPPPTLAAKLQISAAAPAYVWGTVDDPTLQAALAGATTIHPSEASVLVAVVLQDTDLHTVLVQHANMPCPAAWLVYRKGAKAVLDEQAIRQRMRAQGYMDNRVSAVSEQLTATRYARRAQRTS